MDGEGVRVTALATEHSHDNEIARSGPGLMHMLQGHSVHDHDCEHCMMGRMRHKPRRRVVGPRLDQRGGSVYIDLMGPFEEDIEGNVWDMTVLEGKCGWMEVVGLRDKSSETTNECLDPILTDISNNTNQLKRILVECTRIKGTSLRGCLIRP